MHFHKFQRLYGQWLQVEEQVLEVMDARLMVELGRTDKRLNGLLRLARS